MGRRPRIRATRRFTACAAIVVAMTTAACGSSAGTHPNRSPSRPHVATAGSTLRHGVIRVPQDAPTIAKAVAEAAPGAVVLISPGTYHESVQVDRPHVTIRGLDRNRVVLDEDVLRPNGVVLTGDGDAVQNLTVRNATLNGVLVTGDTDGAGNGIAKGSDGYSPNTVPAPLSGFLVDHVTSYNNGLYGVYAFDAVHGEIENSYTSGMADSGIYVGECKPCHIGVHDDIAERNAVGYEGTNASGGIVVYGNRFVGNRVGATTDSDHLEGLVPQDGAVMVGNVIAANDAHATPEQADGGFGIGVGIAGGTHNLLARNLIVHNPVVGVEITNFDDLPPVANQVVGNHLAQNGVDVVYSASAAQPGSGNCLDANVLTTVRPASLPRTCPATGSHVAGVTAPPTNPPPGIPFTTVAAPPSQPQLPNASSAPAPVTSSLPSSVDVATIALPAATLLQEHSAIRW